MACDQTPSILYINQGNGRFVDEAMIRGVAFDEYGKAMSGMGVTAGDYLHEGRPSIFRTNFSDELETLYHNRGEGDFEDVSVDSGLGRNSRATSVGALAFSTSTTAAGRICFWQTAMRSPKSTSSISTSDIVSEHSYMPIIAASSRISPNRLARRFWNTTRRAEWHLPITTTMAWSKS